MESFRIRFVLGLIALSLGHVSGVIDTSSIFFRHFKRDGSHNDYNINKIDLLSPELKSNESTIFYIHGFGSNTDDDSVTITANAYLKVTTDNVIAIDYRQIADNGNYITNVIHVADVAKAIANALNQLVKNGLNSDKIHIIGHSLGAQVAGHIHSYINFILDRVTGLDPAGPLFYTGRFLKSGDGKFVDIIHSDAGIFGQVYNSGDANFLPNGGHRPQPGCSVVPFVHTQADHVLGDCNHERSWEYYAESVLNPDGFMAIQCDNSFLFSIGKCNQSNVVPMGYAAPTSARGDYYLHTNSQSPFAEGLQGIY